MKDERVQRAGALLDEAGGLIDEAAPWLNWALMGLAVLLLALFGAICFYLGRLSVERAPERLTVIHRLA